jgi:hypothetical protein
VLDGDSKASRHDLESENILIRKNGEGEALSPIQSKACRISVASDY